MRFYLSTLGCRLNEAEQASWQRQLAGRGHRLTVIPEEADVIVANTCAVTAEAARKSRKLVGHLHRKSPEARVVVTGCYAQLDADKVARDTGVDLVVDNRDKERLVDLVTEHFEVPDMPELARDPGSNAAFPETRTRAFIKVQDGCRNQCTFCIVTSLRGDERSRTIDDIVREVRLLTARGYQEAVLTGVHLGGYGSDLGVTLVDLVRAILEKTSIPRLRLSSLEPWDLPDDFADLWDGHERLLPHLHLPLQSGSDSVLRRMARRCPTAKYRELVERLRARVRGLEITTDLIVGFPGETEDEWRETVNFVKSIGFSHVHIFTYSRREGTPAARMKGHLAKDIKRTRSREMHELAENMKADAHSRAVGQVRPVLWEGEGTPNPDGSIRFAGYTDNYLRVECDVAAGVTLENRVTSARLSLAEPPSAALRTELSPSDAIPLS